MCVRVCVSHLDTHVCEHVGRTADQRRTLGREQWFSPVFGKSTETEVELPVLGQL